MHEPLDFKNYVLGELHKLLHEGRFAVPKLQRVFVWNGRKAANLLDTVYRRMPIGALTIWDTESANRNLLRVESTVLPPYNNANKRVWFVLDGQQRLSVLYRILEGGTVTTGSKGEVDFSRLVFRVTEGDTPSRFQYRKPVPKEWISLPDILDANWQSKHLGLSKRQLNRVEDCRTRLLTYPVPIVVMSMESIEDARELFLRINSSGTPLSSADRAFARASKFDLREMARTSWEKLKPEFRGLDNEVLLQTRALLDDVLDVGVDAMNKVVDQWDTRIKSDAGEIKRFNREWDAQRTAMNLAIDLLSKQFHVLDEGLLPSRNMVTTLTVFFYENKRRPSQNQMREIKKWFWGTALGQRYSGRGFRQNILDDVSFFRKLATGTEVKFKLSELIDPADVKRAVYGKRSSISDAFFCLLIGQVPQRFSDGTSLHLDDPASAANRKHKHHIFPRKLLRNHGVGTGTLNTILNLCFISADENSQFGARSPLNYLRPHLHSTHFSRVINRHLIPQGDDSGLWQANKKGYDLFIRNRKKLVCKAFEIAAGTKLFRKE